MLNQFTEKKLRGQGVGCEKATRFLEEALGVVGSKVKKPEFHQQAVVHKQQQQLGR